MQQAIIQVIKESIVNQQLEEKINSSDSCKNFRAFVETMKIKTGLTSMELVPILVNAYLHNAFCLRHGDRKSSEEFYVIKTQIGRAHV